jgi:GT2 family glycosyltransferase
MTGPQWRTNGCMTAARGPAGKHSIMTDPEVALSLVLATVGRTDPINVFLDSLCDPYLDRIELIVVDQNKDDRVRDLLEKRRDPLVIRQLASPRGLSRARNVGMAAANGRLLGFPDDDCWYTPRFISRILDWFERHPGADGLSCRVSDADGAASAGGYMSRQAQWITQRNVWRCLVSPGLFIRRHACDDLAFDESLGVGAATPWGSAEESDFVLRGLSRGLRVFYDPALTVIHPHKVERLCRNDFVRGWRYGRGMGYVLRRNGYGPGSAGYYAALSTASAGVSLLRGRAGSAGSRLCMSIGRLSGWWAGRRQSRAAVPKASTKAREKDVPETTMHLTGQGASLS